MFLCGASMIISNKNEKKMVNGTVTEILKNNPVSESGIAIMKDGDESLLLLAACGGYGSGRKYSSYNPTIHR